MKLSIIVVAYNVEPYIEECLRSCAFRDLQSYEVIVVVNKSDDRTEAVARGIGDQHPGIFRFISLTENIGLGLARNAGLKEAHGEYVAFLDGDDWYSEEAETIFKEALTEVAFDACVCSHQRVYSSGAARQNTRLQGFARGKPVNGRDREPLLLNLNTAWNKIISRRFLQAHHLIFEAGFYEDIDWGIKLLALCDCLIVEPRVLVCYRQRDGSITQSVDGRHFDVFARYQAVVTFLDASPAIARSYGPAIYGYCGRNLTIMLEQGRLPNTREREFMIRAAQCMRALRMAAGRPLFRMKGWWRELGFYLPNARLFRRFNSLRRSI